MSLWNRPSPHGSWWIGVNQSSNINIDIARHRVPMLYMLYKCFPVLLKLSRGSLQLIQSFQWHVPFFNPGVIHSKRRLRKALFWMGRFPFEKSKGYNKNFSIFAMFFHHVPGLELLEQLATDCSTCSGWSETKQVVDGGHDWMMLFHLREVVTLVLSILLFYFDEIVAFLQQ